MSLMINTSTADPLGLRPIEFLLPNAVLAMTEWRTQTVKGDEFNFSMEHLYLLINYALNFLFPKFGVPDSFITPDLFDRPVDFVNENKLELIEHYRFVIMLGLGTAFVAIIIPLFAFICCCLCKPEHSSLSSKSARKTGANIRASGSSSSSSNGRYVHHYTGRGSRSARQSRGYAPSSSSSSSQNRSHNRSSQSCQKFKVEGSCDCCTRPILSLFLLFLLVLCFIFVVCAFVTNDSIHRGVKTLPQSANGSLSDVEIYLNNTQYEFDVLFKTNYAQLEQQIRKSLNRSGEIVNTRLAIISEAVSINNLTQIVSNLQPIMNDLKRLINNTKDIKRLTAQLKIKITRSRKDLEEFFSDCRHPICEELSESFEFYMQRFQISARIDSIPQLNPILDKIEYLMRQDIVGKIQDGKHAMDVISREIQSVVNEILPQVFSQMSQVSKTLSANVDSLNGFLALPLPHIRTIQSEIYQSDRFVRQHDQYIYYVGFVCASVLLAILLFYFLGLMFGLCNNLPTVYDYKKRSRKSEVFFCFGFLVFFLAFTGLLIASVVLFVSGGLTESTACFYLKNVSNPQTEKILSLARSELQQRGFVAEHRELLDTFDSLKINHEQITQFIERCHQNQSLFNVLQLPMDRKIKIEYDNKRFELDLNEVVLFKEKTKIESYLNGITQRLNINPEDITLLSSEAENLINVLKDSSLETLNFSSFANNIKNSISPLNFEVIAKKLEEESSKLPESEIENAARLHNIAIDLKSSKELINSITAELDSLTRNAQKIEQKSNFGGVGLQKTLVKLLKQARDAQKFFAEKGRHQIRVVLRSFIDEISEMIAQYIGHAENRVRNEIGRCEPVSRAYNFTVNSFCNEIVQPYTACWFSIYISMLLFLPATLVALYLRALFRRIKRSSVRRESVIIFDNYEDDSIPLAEIEKESSRRIVPSAPSVSAFDHYSEDGSWSPPPTTTHYSTRPPPYNF